MKNILTLLACCLLTACAAQEPVRKVNKTSNHKLNDSDTVLVDCTGNSFESAKESCFKKAIQQVVGVAIVSATDVDMKEKEVKKKNILTHSAGYVDGYEVITDNSRGNNYSLTMNVVVKSSRIHEQILGQFWDQDPIDGRVLTEKYNSFMAQKRSGDSILSDTLKNLDKYGFEVTKKSVNYEVDRNRNPILTISYSVFWNYKYLVALNEALSMVHDGHKSVGKKQVVYVQSKNPDNLVLGETNEYHFTDSTRSNMIMNKLSGPVHIVATVYGWDSSVIYKECSKAEYLMPVVVDETPIHIRGSTGYLGEIVINLNSIPQNATKFNQASKVELTIDRNLSQCLNFKKQFTKR